MYITCYLILICKQIIIKFKTNHVNSFTLFATNKQLLKKKNLFYFHYNTGIFNCKQNKKKKKFLRQSKKVI
jgi:hypothetical protein